MDRGFGVWVLGALGTIDTSDLRSVLLGFFLVGSSSRQKPRACHSASLCHRWHRVFGAPIVWLHMSQYRTRMHVDVYLLWVSLQVQSNVRHGTSRGCTGFACHRVRKWEGFSASTQSLLWPTSGLLILCRPMAGLWPWDVKISSSRHILQPYSQDQTARARLICMGSGS